MRRSTLSKSVELMKSFVLLGMMCICLNNDIIGQLPTDTIFDDRQAFRDTINVLKYTSENDQRPISLNDTSLDESGYFFDKAKYPLTSFANLQHIGSAHKNFIWQIPEQNGFYLGSEIYPAYSYKLRNIPRYETNSPYSDLQYSQALTQVEHQVRTLFVRDLQNSTIQLEYNRINDAGLLANQRNLHNNLFIQLRSKHKFGSLKLDFISNVYQSKEGGGVSSTEGFNNPFSNATGNIPQFLNSGQTRHQEKIYSLTDTWDIFNSNNFNIIAVHNAKYRTYYERYYDDNPVEDFYTSYYYDNRGVRVFDEIKTLKNSVGIQLSSTNIDQKRDSSLIDYILEPGIEHQLHSVTRYQANYNVNWLALTGKLRLNLKDDLFINAELTQSFVPDLDDTGIRSNLYYQWKKYISLRGFFNLYRNRPSLQAQNFKVNSFNIWVNDFDPVNIYQVGGKLGIPAIGLEAGLTYSVLGQYIYYGTEGLPIQSNDTEQILQITGTINTKVSHFDFEAIGGFQLNDGEVIDVPNLFLDARAYANFSLFKNRMHIRTGPYARYFDKTLAYYYQPLIGDFHLTDLPDYQTTNFSLNYMFGFRISGFNVYAHIQNIEQIWSEPYSEIAYYPEGFVKWRLGIRWKLLN